jgi:cation:H+ antiporter
VTLLLYTLLFLASIVVTLAGCQLFTNGIEWVGKRLNVSEGAVGSIFAAIGTTLPETSIPIIAIFFGTGPEQAAVGLGAILGAPFMLSTLVLPILAGLLLLYARLGKRTARFHLNYQEVRLDLQFFLLGYGVALLSALTSDKTMHYAAATLLILAYLYYMKIKLSAPGDDGESSAIEPLIFAKRAAKPSFGMIGLQGAIGMAGLVGGAHMFVTAAHSLAESLNVTPLILALLIAPLATELPEMSNSFLWLYRKKDQLAVGNVTGAMVFQGTFPVSVGLIGTEWALGPSALLTMVLAVCAGGVTLLQLLGGGHWRPWLLTGCAILYIGYTLYLYGS